MAMPSVLLVVFVLQLLLNILSTVGAQVVNDIVYLIFLQLPSSHRKKCDSTTLLRNEVVRLQREMIGVSAQDNFAKWARLRRDHDKAKATYEAAATDTKSFRSTFDSIVSKLRWVGTQGVNFLCNTYYSKQPMFWLPQGWVPYQVEWVLSFPRAPLGSISVNIWAIACGSVIAMLSEGVIALWALKAGEVKTGSNKGEKMKPISMPVAASAQKKEL